MNIFVTYPSFEEGFLEPETTMHNGGEYFKQKQKKEYYESTI
jgi:hypothetical protein